MLADAAWIVTDSVGRAAKFVGDITAALLYAARVHGAVAGPMTVAAADKWLAEAAAKLYGPSYDRGSD